MRTGMTLICAAALLSSCGGGGAEGGQQEPEPTEAPPVTLVETCPEIEAKLPRGTYPRPIEWQQYGVELETMSERGDTETRNAIQLITPAVDGLAVDPEGLTDLLDARAALRDGLDTLADRCKAVGSSALQ